MNIVLCFIVPLPPPYGGISHWATLIYGRATRSKNIEISILDTAPRWRGIHNRSVFYRAIGGAFQLFRDVLALFCRLSFKRYTVLHLATSGSLAVIRDCCIAIIARIFRVSFIYHLHFGRVPDLAARSNIEWRLLLFVMNLAEKVIAIDFQTYSVISEFSSRIKVALVPNCVDIESLPIATASDEVRTVVFLGWVVETKGIEELLEAWSRIDICGWRLKIVGPCDAIYKEFLLSRFKALNVDFIGELPHSEAMKVLTSCDLFVLPSYTEGFPNVVLEAMALGKAVVATKVGAIPEMLASECGSLVEVKDVDGLQASIQSLMLNPSRRISMGLNALKRANESYSLDVVFNQYHDIWVKAAE